MAGATEGRNDGEHHGHGHGGPSESVVVDIGGSVGALVVATSATLDGAQIEICPHGGDAASRTHTIVRAREAPGGGVVYAGVFPSLPAGEYTLVAWGEFPETAFSVVGGEVTQLDW